MDLLKIVQIATLMITDNFKMMSVYVGNNITLILLVLLFVFFAQVYNPTVEIVKKQLVVHLIVLLAQLIIFGQELLA